MSPEDNDSQGFRHRCPTCGMTIPSYEPYAFCAAGHETIRMETEGLEAGASTRKDEGIIVPYYEDECATIYNADCLELLRSRSLDFDVVITDPPYNLGIDYGKGTDDKRASAAYRDWCHEWFWKCREQARLVAISPGIGNLGFWYEFEQPTWVMAWNKPAAMGRCVVGFNNWEPVLLWGKMPKRPTSDSFSAPLIPDGSLAGHPCPKPLKWGMELVARLTEPGDTVIDPFMGSGTTVRACATQNREVIGVDIEKDYCDIAIRRLAQGALAI